MLRKIYAEGNERVEWFSAEKMDSGSGQSVFERSGFWKMIWNLTESAETRYNKGKLEMCFSKMFESRTDTEVTAYKDLQKKAVFLEKKKKTAEIRCVFPNAMF